MNPNSNICKWFFCCPIKFFVEEGSLDRKWIENYCLINNKDCVSFQKEERGESHPNNMLPDGTIQENLS